MISDYRRALVPKYVHNTRKPKYFLHANLYISNIQLFLDLLISSGFRNLKLLGLFFQLLIVALSVSIYLLFVQCKTKTLKSLRIS